MRADVYLWIESPLLLEHDERHITRGSKNAFYKSAGGSGSSREGNGLDGTAAVNTTCNGYYDIPEGSSVPGQCKHRSSKGSIEGGFYLYRLEAGTYLETRSMTLVK